MFVLGTKKPRDCEALNWFNATRYRMSIIGSVLSILNIAIKLKISEDSGELKNQYNPIIDLILSAKINMEIIYQKVSTQ